MTELLVTPKSLNHMKTLIELGADICDWRTKIWIAITWRI